MLSKRYQKEKCCFWAVGRWRVVGGGEGGEEKATRRRQTVVPAALLYWPRAERQQHSSFRRHHEEEEEAEEETPKSLRCSSMSTRQMGQRLLVVSHWSTQTTWKRCMQGRRLTSSLSSNSLRQMVHFSTLSSLSPPLLGIFLYLWGKVFRSIVFWEAPRLTTMRRCSNNRMVSWTCLESSGM